MFALVVFGLAWLARSFLVAASSPNDWEDGPYQAPTIDSQGLRMIEEAGRRVRPLHRVKMPPKPGEWLDKHPEAGQTFAAYREERPNHPTHERTTIYLLPMGELWPRQEALIDRTAALLTRFYEVPVKRLDPIGLASLPASARRQREGRPYQLRTPYLLDQLRKRRPVDAVAVMGLTTADLTPGDDWNFVFGQASLTDRVGVWSVHRFGDPETDFSTVLRRTLQTAVHETGHMLGIRHCKAFECGMNGSNHLDEADVRPLGFCPECEMKVWWGCRVVDPRRRYHSLAEFAEAQGLEEDARTWRSAERALRGTP
jgi:archaemetzincin